MTSLFVEHLTVLDCASLGWRRGLSGESWIVDLELTGELDDQSMILDFSTVKREFKRRIEALVDHTLLVPLHAPQLTLLENGEQVELVFDGGAGWFRHRSPRVAVTMLPRKEIGPAELASYLNECLATDLPPSVWSARVGLREEGIDGAWYRYVHGLKKHRGPCQRIAHGHRSRIKVYIDDKRSAEAEAGIAKRWTDIYLGSREDLLKVEYGRHYFGYDAPEGRFEVAMDRDRVYLMDGDTTVERIAEHLRSLLQADYPDAEIEVRAYEGVMKGAVAHSYE